MLRRLCLASAAALGVAAFASAPALAQTAAGPTAWNGPYAGVNVGYGWGNDRYRYSGTSDPAGTLPTYGRLNQDADGWMGGLTLGYNAGVGPGLVLGFETDFDATGIGSRSLGSSPSPSGGVYSGELRSRLNYLGTARLRLGAPIMAGRLMPYVTGGLAYGGVHSSGDYGCTGCAGADPVGADFYSPTKVQAGWTAGGGLEYALDRHMSMKVEYLRVDLGGRDLGVNGGAFSGPDDTVYGPNVSEKLDSNLVRVGFNWHF